MIGPNTTGSADLELLKRARCGLSALSGRLEQQRRAQVAALHAFATLKPELDELCQQAVRVPPQELDLFRVLGVHHMEEVHSNLLAWLLDPEEAHETGSSLLKQFLIRTAKTAAEQGISGIALSRVQSVDWSDTEVRREWNYIDILLLNEREKIVCAIENKIRAPEGIKDGVSQLARYRRLLEAEFPNHERHFVFLTPSGRASRMRQERQFWIPESYIAVQQALKDLLEQGDAVVDAGAFHALAQYETTLRRNIVTSDDQTAELARRIYLENRKAIELVFQHKPDYKADLGQMVSTAIAETDGWLLDHSSPAYVRFRPGSWDRFESQRSGTGWSPSATLILLEVFCTDDPLKSKLVLCLGPGENAPIREEIYDCCRSHPHVFRVGGSLSDSYAHILEPVRLLSEDDVGPAWDDGTAETRVHERLNRFLDEQFPAIDELIRGCFEKVDAS